MPRGTEMIWAFIIIAVALAAYWLGYENGHQDCEDEMASLGD